MTSSQQHSTKQDILRHLLRHGQATAQDLAECLEISPQAIRRHLKDLEGEALIVHQSVAAGMGRPNNVYTLSRKGREQFPDRHDEFAVALLGTLAETMGPEQMGLILQKQWERKALEYRDRIGDGSLKHRVDNLVEIRRTEGYMAECHPVQADILAEALPDLLAGAVAVKTDVEQYVLTEYNCAISQIAESFPSVCGHELEMFAAALPDCTVQRTHWLVDGEHRCGYLIQPK
jgi:DeoR family transcriptional regulator, suf operon transcriptional repressor